MYNLTCVQDADGKEIKQMKYIMRAWDLAKGLLLSGNLYIQMIAFHSDKPSMSWLAKVHQVLPETLNIYISLAVLDRPEIIGSKVSVLCSSDNSGRWIF